MREIKFRAWIKPSEWYDIDKGEMVYGGDMSDFGIMYNGEGFGVLYDTENWLGDDAFVIEQYTGLEDKNGVEIYEGDIIMSKNGNKLTVWFSYGAFNAGNSSLWNSYSTSKVIGNIHEEKK